LEKGRGRMTAIFFCDISGFFNFNDFIEIWILNLSFELISAPSICHSRSLFKNFFNELKNQTPIHQNQMSSTQKKSYQIEAQMKSSN
jgi:hypothetical protein